jgi:hypothetical protein
VSTTTPARGTFHLPDTMTSLPSGPFTFRPQARDEAAQVLSGSPADLFRRLVRDQESEVGLLVARRVLHGFLGSEGNRWPAVAAEDADTIAETVAATRDELAERIRPLAGGAKDRRRVVMRERAPISLLGGCWLDTVSQPATQPSVLVNQLYTHHFRALGEGKFQRSVPHVRSQALERQRVFLPDVAADDFLRRAHSRPLTALHGCFFLALSRLATSFLPEVVGVHYAYHTLGVDDLLLDTTPALPEGALGELLAAYLQLCGRSPDGDADRRRLAVAIQLTIDLEREHVRMLTELASWYDGLTLEDRVAAIILRHAPFAGGQHRDVRVGGQRLSELFTAPDFDVAVFVQLLRDSRQLKPIRGGDGRFLRAIKFGGPMFGIFDEEEATVFKEWAAQVAAGGQRQPVSLTLNRVGDAEASARSSAIARDEPADVVFSDTPPADDRELLHQLVNIERFGRTLPLARERTEEVLSTSEILFVHGAAGRYTDPSYFDYTPQALLERVDHIYWDKLVNPYRPLTEIPDRDEVIFGQKTTALGSLVDGAWAHRIANLGRRGRTSDAMLFSIYADEMGNGDVRKNHITLIWQVLASMSIALPHIRDERFMDQAELPDSYGFSLHQLCLSLFPDSFYNEILGYNLGIEMFGLGEMRMHEMQKLSHHGFDISYEQAHLSIDNFSAGHARQSADIIVAYLDDVARTFGDHVVQQEWRRIWRGYASFAYYVETPIVKKIMADRPAEVVI